MDEETKKIIADQIKQLPRDVKEAIISVDYKTKLQEITKRQKILIDQAAKLEMETTLVMIGLEPLANYVANLERELSVPLLRAKELALDVSEHIFKPIRDSLRVMNEFGENSEVSLRQPSTPADTEELIARFTNSNEANLNRDQILNEIENPSTIRQNINALEKPPVPPAAQSVRTTELEIRPSQEVETLPGQAAKDVKPDLMTAKMSGPTIIARQIVNAKPEIKLPAIEKKRPSSGVDPYREPLM